MANSTVTTKRGSLHTTVALKVLMAVTGLFFVLFVLMHMYGNLKMFAGPETYNGYAEHLRVMGEPILPRNGFLNIFRVLLLAAIIGHVYSALRLWHLAGVARGTKYKIPRGTKKKQSYASRTMRWGGVIILAFIIFHLLQFTTLNIQIGGDYDALTPYERMVAAFQPHNWWCYLLYFVPITLLSFHVRHGVWSALATLGLSTRRREFAFNVIAFLAGAALWLGFLLPPTCIMLGYIS